MSILLLFAFGLICGAHQPTFFVLERQDGGTYKVVRSKEEGEDEIYEYSGSLLQIYRDADDLKLYTIVPTGFSLSAVNERKIESHGGQLNGIGELFTVEDRKSIYVGHVFKDDDDEPLLYIFDLQPQKSAQVFNKFDYGYAKEAAKDFVAISKKESVDIVQPGRLIDLLYAFSEARLGLYMATHAITIVTVDSDRNAKFLYHASQALSLKIGYSIQVQKQNNKAISVSLLKLSSSEETLSYEFPQELKVKLKRQGLSEVITFNFDENDVLVGYFSVFRNNVLNPVYIFDSLQPDQLYLFYCAMKTDETEFNYLRNLMKHREVTIEPHQTYLGQT